MHRLYFVRVQMGSRTRRRLQSALQQAPESRDALNLAVGTSQHRLQFSMRLCNNGPGERDRDRLGREVYASGPPTVLAVAVGRQKERAKRKSDKPWSGVLGEKICRTRADTRKATITGGKPCPPSKPSQISIRSRLRVLQDTIISPRPGTRRALPS